MANILLDGRIIGEELAETATISSAIEYARRSLAGSGDIILGIACDGRDVGVDQIADVLPRAVQEFDRVEFTSGDASGAVIEALSETRLAILDTYATVQQAADDLSTGRIAAGMNGLVRCVNAWSQVHEAVVSGGQLLSLDFEQLVLNGRPLLDWLGDLNRKLRDIKSAVENQDHVLLADILRYEIDQTLQQWEDMLTALIELVRTGPVGQRAAP